MEVKPDDASSLLPQGLPPKSPSPQETSVERVKRGVLGENSQDSAVTHSLEAHVTKVNLSELSSTERKAYIEFLKGMPDSWKGKAGFLQKVETEHEKLETLDQAAKEKKLSEKHSEWWDCIDSRPNEGGGELFDFIYTSDKQRLAKSPYPAGEPKQSDVNYAYSVSNNEKEMHLSKEVAKKIGESETLTLQQAYDKYGITLIRASRNPQKAILIKLFLNDLGIQVKYTKDHSLIVTLPDSDALQVRWNKLREKNLELPPITFHNSDGIAGDLEFTHAYLTDDCLVSRGKELMHDTFFHVTRLITGILNNPSQYKNNRFESVRAIGDSYNRLVALEANSKNIADSWGFTKKDFEILETSLGAATDIHAAGINSRADKQTFQDVASSIFKFESKMEQFATDKLGPEVLVKAPLLWNRLEAATSPLFGFVSEFSEEKAYSLLFNAPIGTQVIGKESIYIKTPTFKNVTQIQQILYELTTTLEEGKTVYHVAFTLGGKKYEESGESYGMVMRKMQDGIGEYFNEQGTKLQGLFDSYMPELKKMDFQKEWKERSNLSNKPIGSTLVLPGSGKDPNKAILYIKTAEYSLKEHQFSPTLHEGKLGFMITDLYGNEKFYEAGSLDEFTLKLKKDLGLTP